MEQKTEKKEIFFRANVENMIATVRDRNYAKFSDFMNEHQQAQAAVILNKQHDVRSSFWGGFPEAERKMLCVYPDYLDEKTLEYPIAFLAEIASAS